jgi:hypothetical protein
MKDELKAGQLRTVLRGGLEGSTVILVELGTGSINLVIKHQIWNSHIVFSSHEAWTAGDRVGLRTCDLVKHEA